MKGNDLDLYERHSEGWWDADDRFFRSLRSVGDFHFGLVRERWAPFLACSRVVELGCGGGYLGMALAEHGARVVGLDLSRGSLRAARSEAGVRGFESRYVCADLLRTPLREGAFDLAVMSDVLEHVEEPAEALREAARLLRPGGRLFLSTFDRSITSAFAVVTLAEGLGLVPRGTHDARLFVRPAELEAYAEDAGLVVEEVVRERPALGRTIRTWTIHLEEARRGPGYSAFLRKERAA